jgi:hypothetical protein
LTVTSSSALYILLSIYIFCDAGVEKRLGKPLKYSSDMMYLFSPGNGSL